MAPLIISRSARSASAANGRSPEAHGRRGRGVSPETGWRAPLSALLVAIPPVLLLPVLAGHYVENAVYIRDTVLATAALAALVVAFHRADRLTRAAERLVAGYPVALLSVAVVAAGVLIRFLALDNVPHLSDEVAYQFQARAMAAGGLTVASPPRPEFFGFLHTLIDGDRWYGIMNPGWPALLALGERAGVPWLVNPLLSAATILVLFAFLRRVGYGELEARLAVLLLATSPFVLFLSGTIMSHPANLLLFAVFLWAGAVALETGKAWYAALAGLALAANILVRPLDSVLVSAPFVVYFIYQATLQPRLLRPLVLAAALAALGIVATLLYNQALTGDYRLMPVTKFFREKTPGQAFGLGFGDSVGTSLHGPEWPGYHLWDAVRVTSFRWAQFLQDVRGLPLVFLAFLLYPLFDRRQLRDAWHTLILLSALCVAVTYFFHFYPGGGYGSRHYYLLLPAAAVACARPLAGWLRSPDPRTARWARAGLLALLVFTAVPFGRLWPQYAGGYRQASGLVRDAVAERGLGNALVFVAEDGWAWKSAFPLNRYPLRRNDVIFARDRGGENDELRQEFPYRSAYHLRVVGGGRVEITPLVPESPR